MNVGKYLTVGILVVMCPAWAQRGAGRGNGAPRAAEEKPEEGIPVTNPLVVSKCGGCHTKDEKGNLSRISWERTTPEGWEEAIKRMVRLNGLQLSPADARAIVKYLSTYHGLAPEEAKPVMYMPEHRIIDEAVPNEGVHGACMVCHPLGRALSWRRSKDDWKLLTNLHVALYAQAEAAFRRGARGGGGGAAAGGGRGGAGEAAVVPAAAAASPRTMPVDDAIEFLGKSATLHTPEWAAWRARMRTPKLTGRWLVSANIPGRGKYFGEMVVEPGASDDEFTTRVKLESGKDGSTLSRSGQGIVYTGYSWRGRSKSTGAAGNAPDDLSKEMREAMWFSPDQSWAEGRWFWGEYQEFGVDVRLQRATSEPALIGVNKTALKVGSTGNHLRVYVDNIPAQLTAADLDLGSGVTVKKIVAQNGISIDVDVDVAADAVPGKRDVALRRSVLESAIAVYDRVDYIKVTPGSSIARLGSDAHPKGYQQFEAIGYQRGADGKVNTADDVELGPVDVTWSVEEFITVFGDDDKDFVGTLSAAGLFTPASDGPNPKRKFSRNNYGDVWVVGTAKNEKDKDGKPLQAKSYLVVTVPTYIRWDQPEVDK